ncbi:MAG: VWA domain-containing protein [Bacteroidales bacterium]|nr:VWA domain-containing protein [Bacteroidales bacterium]
MTTLLYSQIRRAPSQEEPQVISRILFIFDASNSMNARWESDTRINVARRILIEIVDSLANTPNVEMALRLFGHQSQFPPMDCSDTRLEVPFAPNNARAIINMARGIIPRGSTPIAHSLEQAANDFPPCDNCRNIIILITDGIETCDGDPCAASEFLQRSGIALKPFVIGIGVGEDFAEAFGCVGRHFDAENESEFLSLFRVIISQALETTTAQVNLLDLDGNPSETNVNMTFSDYFFGVVKFNYVHTKNIRGLSDTVTLDPLITYRMTVHSIPPVIVDSIVLLPGRHNVIYAEVPQGQLRLIMTPGSTAARAQHTLAIIRKHGETEIIHVQNLNSVERYLVGNYDVEVLTMPRILIPNVRVDQSKITTVEVPRPGVAVIHKSVEGHGSLYVEDETGMRLIHNMNPTERIETLHLQPGHYRVVLRSRFIPRANATMERRFTIEEGRTTTVRI